MSLLTRSLLSFTLAISFAGCGQSDTAARVQSSAAGNVRDDIYLSFMLDGDGFSNESFEFEFGTDLRSLNGNYWMAYQDREQTTFRMEGQSGDWSIDINFKISAEALGVYPFEPDDLNSNRDFDFTLRHETVEEPKSEYDGEYISGTFTGTFFRGSIVNQSERTQVTVSDGRFRVNWADGQRNTNKDRWP
jgi:hypothetical protein